MTAKHFAVNLSRNWRHVHARCISGIRLRPAKGQAVYNKKTAWPWNCYYKNGTNVLRRLGHADIHFIISFHDAKLHEQLFQLFHLKRGRNHQHFVVIYFLRQG